MTVKEMMERLSEEPLDAVILVAQGTGKFRRAYKVQFEWTKQVGSEFESRTSKVDDQTKTSVVIWS